MHSSAHYLLQGLTDLGIEYVFSNLGTDHASVIEELARWREQGAGIPASCSARTKTSRSTWQPATRR